MARLKALRLMEMSGKHPTFYRVLRGFSQLLQATADSADPRQNRAWPLPFTSFQFIIHLSSDNSTSTELETASIKQITRK
jgi:hypothetical protein